MVFAYWQIGKMIVEKQDGHSRADYGDGLFKESSIQMTKDFGKGFTVSNIKYMRQLYLTFPKGHALRGELSWTHYRLVLSLDDENARNFYIKEAIEGNWSTRQLEREMHTLSYQRYLASNNNHDVIDDTATKEENFDSKDIIKDPYVLEFAGLNLIHRFMYIFTFYEIVLCKYLHFTK